MLNQLSKFLKKNQLAEYLCLMAVFLLSISASSPLFMAGFFPTHDDVQIMRLYEMEKCFDDWQLPCRWVPDMGAGYGHPLFNYHPVFPYYLGMVVRLLGFSLIDSTKILFFLSILLSGVLMFYFVKTFFGRLSGLLSAALYIFAPYHAVDVYVRGAMTESWGVVFFPLILLTIYKALTDFKAKYFVGAVVSLSLLYLSHNIMTLLFTPIAFLWSIFWVIQSGKYKLIIWVIGIFIWSIGLSAFFVVPAYLEQSLVTINSLISDYYSYQNHFVTVSQLFIDRSFGFGPSWHGSIGGLSFQLGLPHWVLSIISGFLIIRLVFKTNKIPWLLTFIFAIWAFSVIMTHAKSVILWQAIPPLSFVQFPWRFLAIAMFTSSFLGGWIITLFKKELVKIIVFLSLLFITLALNISYFKPEKIIKEINDTYMLSGEKWVEQSRATLLDYRPKGVSVLPESIAPHLPYSDQPIKLDVNKFSKNSNTWFLDITNSQKDNVDIMVPIFNFPIWEILMDSRDIMVIKSNPEGVIQLEVPPGNHLIMGSLKDTQLRTFANITSTVFLALTVTVLLVLNIRRHKVNV